MAAPTGTGRPQVSFTNSYGKKLSVAYMRREYSCQTCGDIWDVLGWINLEPGETKTRENATKNRWFYFYAEAVDGAVWNGDYPAEVTDTRFEKCTCHGAVVVNGDPHNPYYTVGFDELDSQEFSGITFTPS
jgi:hypothetical protein